MTWILRWPLRYVLLGVLCVFAVFSCIGTYWMSVTLVYRQAEHQARTELRADLHRLQGGLQILLRTGHLEEVRNLVTSVSAKPGHELTLVTAADGTIIAATRLAMLDTPWTAWTSDLDPTLIAHFAATVGAAVHLAEDGHSLSGYVKVCGAEISHAVAPASCGFLYTRQHLGMHKALLAQVLRRQTMAHGGGLVLIAVVLWGVVHVLVSRPVERLIATTRQWATGSLQVRTGLSGQADLARVGQALDTMAQSLADHQQGLAAANQQLARRLAEQQQAEAALAAQITASETQRRRLATLVTVAQRLTRGLTLPTVLHGIADATAEIFGGEAAFRLLEGEWLVRMGATPGAEATMVRDRVRLGESLSGRVVAGGQALISHDVASETSILPEHRAATQPERTGALLCVPVGLAERVLGTLHIYRERGYVFTPDDLALATSLAQQTAIAIENARLFEAVQARSTSLAQSNAELQREVAERQRVEAALREREARFHAVVETAAEGIITIDAAGIIETYNSAAERLFGYPATAVVGQNVKMLMPAPYHDEHDAYLRRYLQTGVRQIIGIGREVVGRRHDGTTFPMTLAVSEMLVGERRMFTGLVSDITARKQAEEALRQAHDALEQRVQERTVALAEANEEVRRFVYIVSHDLRAPLVNLRGFVGELRQAHEVLTAALQHSLPHVPPSQVTEVQRVLAQDLPEALDFINASVTRMDTLIRAVLHLSRVGHRELAFTSVDMNAIVQDTLGTLAHQMAQRQVQVTVGTLPQVYADDTAMAQVMGNLLTNAVHYLEPGRPGEIVITGEHQATTTVFTVRDNGRGIDHDDVPTVFEPFRRVGRQDVPGEGMGLAYVRTLVRRHGGEITCQSTLGSGTTFTFTIAHQVPDAGPPAG